jgi:cyclin-dependent kinase 7
MSAVREVKYLRELHHPNIIEVRTFLLPPTISIYTVLPTPHPPLSVPSPKLLDVFSSKTNLNLVLEFLDTDLEMIIKDRSLVFLPADIKSWMAMTFRGLEFCHRNFILHRVRTQPHRA